MQVPHNKRMESDRLIAAQNRSGGGYGNGLDQKALPQTRRRLIRVPFGRPLRARPNSAANTDTSVCPLGDIKSKAAASMLSKDDLPKLFEAEIDQD